jgi:hypothetical protein
MIDSALSMLQDVQETLNAISAESWEDDEDDGFRRIDNPDRCCSRLFVADLGGVLAVEYYGENWGDAWELIQDTLANATVAPHIGLLRLNGPDEGANGLRTWDFTTLNRHAPRFDQLREFYIRPTEAGDHNISNVEDDQIPDLLATMPRIRTLTLPQAPEPGFFATPLRALQWIRIGMAHRTHGFIRGLAQAEMLDSLYALDFTDALAPWNDLEAQPPEWSSTPFEDYIYLFRSRFMDRIKALRLRNTGLTEAQYRQLQEIRPDCQFSVVLESPHAYVSHWGNSRFPYRHLLPFG